MRAPDLKAAAQGIAIFLRALGYEERSELVGTPDRVAEAFAHELLRGERVDVAELLREGSEPATAATSGLVVVRDIAVVAVCPHHLLPAVGRATVAYLPGERLLGLGTVARLAQACSQRLALQEAIGDAVVEALLTHARARGAFCRLSLLHTCLATRGAEQPDARLVTIARGGSLATPDGALELSLALGEAAK
ncbi:MAG TPA: GTP cyclohydrolase I [Polyangiaceae bacterium]|nr:GTP cyclohydrolase I [Polyangiaceae bacterium]